ncbi:hypothetical protein ECPA40_2449 [Escherichia coli PA40]|nr:hypothetical protein ECPA40_2449 [Escherichia coli PA40]
MGKYWRDEMPTASQKPESGSGFLLSRMGDVCYSYLSLEFKLK